MFGCPAAAAGLASEAGCMGDDALTKAQQALSQPAKQGYLLQRHEKDLQSVTVEPPQSVSAATTLQAAGITAAQMQPMGFAPAQVQAAGVTAAQMQPMQLATAQMQQMGFAAAQMQQMQVAAAQMQPIGFTASQLQPASQAAHMQSSLPSQPTLLEVGVYCAH